MRISLTLLACLLLASCGPYQPVVLKSVKNVHVESLDREKAKLTADASLHNPNQLRARLKKISVNVKVDGKDAATVDQKLKSIIKPKSDFIVPIEVYISLKEFGIMDTIFSLLSGKKYKVEYKGHLRMKVGGVPVKVPIEFEDEVRLRP